MEVSNCHAIAAPSFSLRTNLICNVRVSKVTYPTKQNLCMECPDHNNGFANHFQANLPLPQYGVGLLLLHTGGDLSRRCERLGDRLFLVSAAFRCILAFTHVTGDFPILLFRGRFTAIFPQFHDVFQIVVVVKKNPIHVAVW